MFHYDMAHQKWLAGARGGKVLHSYSRTFEGYKAIPLNDSTERLSFIKAIVPYTIVGTNHGVYRYDYPNGSLVRLSNTDTIHYTCALQQNDTLWLGTDRNGLQKYDSVSGQSIDNFASSEGLPVEVIYDIQEDKFGDLWLSTNHGLYQFRKKIKTFNHYDEKNGLNLSEYNSNATATWSNGSLLFGGINGVNYFTPVDNKLSDTLPFKLVLQCKYVAGDSLYVFDFNNSNVDTTLNLPNQIGYLEVTPMLGHYLDTENNRFELEFNGRPIKLSKDGRYIIPESWFVSNLWPSKKNELKVKYRSEGSKWISAPTIDVNRAFFNHTNWLYIQLFFVGLAALILFIRSQRTSKKLRLVQVKINEISRLDGAHNICTMALDHLVKDLQYDYAVISVVDFNKKTINTDYIRDDTRSETDIADWKSKSRYSLEDDDILAHVATLGVPVTVIANKLISNANIRLSEKTFNKNISERLRHHDLARVFVPIIHKSLISFKQNEKEDTVLGVVEVGFRMNRMNRYFVASKNSILAPARKIFNILKYIQNQQLHLQLHIDNLDSPYYKAYIKDQKRALHEFIENAERESDLQRWDHTGFLEYALAQLAMRMGADYGDVFLSTFNSEGIDFQHSHIAYGYKRDNAYDYAKSVAEKHRDKIGIINYVANRKKLYYSGDIRTTEKYLEFIPTAKSELAMPMLFKGYLVGVLNLLSNKEKYFNIALAEIYQIGANRLTEIYMQKKQFVSLQDIGTPVDAFSQTEEKLYASITHGLRKYFNSDYINVWVRTSSDSNIFSLFQPATLPRMYALFEEEGFTKFEITPKYEQNISKEELVELITPETIKNKNSIIYKFCMKHSFKGYIVLKIIIDNKYQAFINVFSKRNIHSEEITGYSRLLLQEVSKRVAMANWNITLANSIDVISRSLAKGETKSTLEAIVDQAYRMSPSAYSVILFPYKQGKSIILKDAIVGGRMRPEISEDTESEVVFANYIIEYGSQWIENEEQFGHLLDLAGTWIYK